MLLLFAALALMATPEFAAGQIPFESSTGPIPYNGQYNRGQDVVPSYDGWKANPDGTLSMFFGYMNRNYEEQLDIDIGPNNNVDGGDRGQPTHFYPRRHCEGLASGGLGAQQRSHDGERRSGKPLSE